MASLNKAESPLIGDIVDRLTKIKFWKLILPKVDSWFKQGGTPIGRQHSGQCCLLLLCMNPSPQSGSCLPMIFIAVIGEDDDYNIALKKAKY